MPDGKTAAQVALAWIAELPEVSTVIPGARNPEQARANAEAGALRDDFRRAVREIYDRHFRAAVHSRWQSARDEDLVEEREKRRRIGAAAAADVGILTG